MKYYIISGEASGDLHGSKLIRELKLLDPYAIFRCWGGDLMQNEGADIVRHYKDLAFMGFIEVVKNLGTIFKNISFCNKDIKTFNPDIIILIDYPGFNLRIAKTAKKAGFKICYYITPQVWAWKESRVNTLKKYIDKNLVILPFEKEYLKNHGCSADFVGHPLLDSLEEFRENNIQQSEISKLNPENKPIIALLPGSRKQEIQKILSLMIPVASEYPGCKFIIAGVGSLSKDFYNSLIEGTSVSIVFGATYQLLRNSTAALVTSGTATLETALFEVPEIVCYKANSLSVFIARMLIKVKFISLVNLIMDREVVKELIQNDLNIVNIKSELDKILYNDSARDKMKEDYLLLKEKLGGKGASARAAKIIFELK